MNVKDHTALYRSEKVFNTEVNRYFIRYTSVEHPEIAYDFPSLEVDSRTGIPVEPFGLAFLDIVNKHLQQRKLMQEMQAQKNPAQQGDPLGEALGKAP